MSLRKVRGIVIRIFLAHLLLWWYSLIHLLGDEYVIDYISLHESLRKKCSLRHQPQTSGFLLWKCAVSLLLVTQKLIILSAVKVARLYCLHLLLDSKLNFNEYVNHIKRKSNQGLNIVKCLAGVKSLQGEQLHQHLSKKLTSLSRWNLERPRGTTPSQMLP